MGFYELVLWTTFGLMNDGVGLGGCMEQEGDDAYLLDVGILLYSGHPNERSEMFLNCR